MKRTFAVISFLLLLMLSGCTDRESHEEDGRPLVVTTTNLIYDAVRKVAGDEMRVISLMGPGVDPHLYRATPRDFRNMERADVILYNGLFLEGRLSEILERIGNRARAVTDAIDPEELLRASDFGGEYDPHVWFDAMLWSVVIDHIAEILGELLPEEQKTFRSRSLAYRSHLEELHHYARERIASIPEQQRVLITSHDAFRYFGRAYGIEVRGLQGLSTAAEFGIRDVSQMVTLLIEREIPAIFIESSVSSRSIESVLAGARERGFEVRLGGMLYSDSMGSRGTPEGTYTGMFRHNVETIAGALVPPWQDESNNTTVTP